MTASDDFTMYLWEPSESTKPVARLLGHQKQINHATFSPDGFWIASSGWDNHVKLWRSQDGKFMTTLRGHVGPVSHLYNDRLPVQQHITIQKINVLPHIFQESPQLPIMTDPSNLIGLHVVFLPRLKVPHQRKQRHHAEMLGCRERYAEGRSTGPQRRGLCRRL